jgi:4-amino-4-deoxy-L-arabinose transferase-like glycosyltransferase
VRATRSAVLVALVVIVGAGLGLRLAYAAEGRDHLPPDSRVYAQIAENLYRDGDFDARGPDTPRIYQPTSAYSPGLPFFVAGVYMLTGGVHLELARIVLALFGAASVLLTYFLGLRLAGPAAGLIGAAALAIYPALLEYQGLLLTEPLAAFLLVAALLAFLRAEDGGSIWWGVGAGALFAALALVRAEYLAVAILVPLLSLARRWRRADLRAAIGRPAVMLLATLVVLAPWALRNAVALDRFVPISTGGGKALYIGTYLDADGDGPKLRTLLLERYPGLRAQILRNGPPEDPNQYALERLLARVAADTHPGLDTEAALAKIGRHNLHDDITEHPLRFAGLLADKAYDSWTEPARGVMDEFPWRLLQLGLLIAALGGLAVLSFERRFEALALGLILLYVTAVAALLISSPRRALITLPLVAALAGVGIAWVASFARERAGTGAAPQTR